MKINYPLKLKNPVQKYAWGSHTAIQKLMNEPSTEEPWAEVWMGVHPKAPSQVYFWQQWIALPDFIRRFPEQILGPAIVDRYDSTLPYLFKLLAAEQPLSIQAHPNAEQARAGFEKESAHGPDINAPHRNYKDPNHKPECICALTRFTGLKGFRKIDAAIELINAFCPHSLADERNALRKKDLKLFFKSLMELPESRKAAVISEVMDQVKKKTSPADICDWIDKLYRRYPSDIGVISPLFLNLFCLEPGQALFLPAGELHAYLDGFGIELMANSDNVLRGGLTPKHVDVPELLKVLDFSESDVDILTPHPISDAEAQYTVPAQEFALSTIHISNAGIYQAPVPHSAEILLCVEGNAHVATVGDDQKFIDIQQGEAVLIPADAAAYQVTGNARFYKAGIPL